MFGLEYKFDVVLCIVIKFCWISKYKMFYFFLVIYFVGELFNGWVFFVVMM